MRSHFIGNCRKHVLLITSGIAMGFSGISMSKMLKQLLREIMDGRRGIITGLRYFPAADTYKQGVNRLGL
jgi:hypothetical protein